MSAETLGLTPDDYAHWHRIGGSDFCSGRQPTFTGGDVVRDSYITGYREAERRAKVSKGAAATNSDPHLTIQRQRVEIAHLQNALQAKESAAPTTQQLIDSWVAAHNTLRVHVKQLLPWRCKVEVDDPGYKGVGIVTGFAELKPNKVMVRIPDGAQWEFLATNVRRVP